MSCEELRALYDALEHGVRDNLFESREACLAHFRDPAHLERYARDEYKNSLGTLKAIENASLAALTFLLTCSGLTLS